MSLVRVVQITAENTGSLVEGGSIIDTGSFFLRNDTGGKSLYYDDTRFF